MSHNKERVKIQRETICKGCDANIPSDSCSYLPIIHEGTSIKAICPCSVCLVKVICKEEKGCEMIEEYYVLMNPVRDRLGLKPPSAIKVKIKEPWI